MLKTASAASCIGATLLQEPSWCNLDGAFRKACAHSHLPSLCWSIRVAKLTISWAHGMPMRPAQVIVCCRVMQWLLIVHLELCTQHDSAMNIGYRVLTTRSSAHATRDQKPVREGVHTDVTWWRSGEDHNENDLVTWWRNLRPGEDSNRNSVNHKNSALTNPENRACKFVNDSTLAGVASSIDDVKRSQQIAITAPFTPGDPRHNRYHKRLSPKVKGHICHEQKTWPEQDNGPSNRSEHLKRMLFEWQRGACYRLWLPTFQQ